MSQTRPIDEHSMHTRTCGELRRENVGEEVTLTGWVSRRRDHGGLIFCDLRDREGITQLTFDPEHSDGDAFKIAETMRPEWPIKIHGVVRARGEETTNTKLATGEIEVLTDHAEVLNTSVTPPFQIEDGIETSEDTRLRYRYLDLRRPEMMANLKLRSDFTFAIREALHNREFMEVETPSLFKSTPEGARDFIVPSRIQPGNFYALPQSPQLLKQLLMVGGVERYYQVAKCFRDEDLRADRQPEFTQIDCEMSFVEQEDVLQMFEGMARHLFHTIKGIDLPQLPRMTWADAMKYYGSDKPDTRFGMRFVELKNQQPDNASRVLVDSIFPAGFSVFDDAAYIGAICCEGQAVYTRKQIDQLTDFVKRPQVGAKGLVYARVQEDGSVKSSVDKFYSQDTLVQLRDRMEAKAGDLILILSGDDAMKVRKQLCELRLEMGTRMGLRDKDKYSCLWVIDFPMYEWSDEEQRLMAMHHPFTSPKPEDIPLLDTDPASVRANAYDMVINGVEVGGGSIRIHDAKLQQKIFEILGFTPEQAQRKFGFLMNAFKYGAPPHGGLAYGLDRFVSLFAGLDSIRDCIAFPKNNSGRDVMLDAPGIIEQAQLDELAISVNLPE